LLLEALAAPANHLRVVLVAASSSVFGAASIPHVSSFWERLVKQPSCATPLQPSLHHTEGQGRLAIPGQSIRDFPRSTAGDVSK